MHSLLIVVSVAVRQQEIIIPSRSHLDVVTSQITYIRSSPTPCMDFSSDPREATCSVRNLVFKCVCDSHVEFQLLGSSDRRIAVSSRPA